jgi:hypothetical protein
MDSKQQSIRYWIVNCLGCRNPIPLFAETITDPNPSALKEGFSGRPYFRAWCQECGREYPYLSEAMISTTEPPLDKWHRQVEFTRMNPPPRVHRAHA